MKGTRTMPRTRTRRARTRRARTRARRARGGGRRRKKRWYLWRSWIFPKGTKFCLLWSQSGE